MEKSWIWQNHVTAKPRQTGLATPSALPVAFLTSLHSQTPHIFFCISYSHTTLALLLTDSWVTSDSFLLLAACTDSFTCGQFHMTLTPSFILHGWLTPSCPFPSHLPWLTLLQHHLTLSVPCRTHVLWLSTASSLLLSVQAPVCKESWLLLYVL